MTRFVNTCHPGLTSLTLEDGFTRGNVDTPQLKNLTLQSVKFLTLNLEFIQLLSSYVELISHHPSPFSNLKSLKIYPIDVTRLKVTVPKEVQNYVLDSYPDATLTMASHEAIRGVMNVASMRNLMRELQMLLDQWKEYC
ncbi:hypothetical protein Hanom_Chr06g00551711 [Helianthus anomalus]